MKTIQLTDKMVERLTHFYNLPECNEDDEYDTAMEIVHDLALELNKK